MYVGLEFRLKVERAYAIYILYGKEHDSSENLSSPFGPSLN